MSLRRGRSRTQHSGDLQLFPRKGGGRRGDETRREDVCVWMSAFPGGVNLLLTPSLYAKMANSFGRKELPDGIIISARRRALKSLFFFSVPSYFLPLDLPFFSPPFAFIYIFMFCNLCSAKDELTSILAN